MHIVLTPSRTTVDVLCRILVLILLKTRIVGGPESSDPEEQALIFALELDDVQVSGSWLSTWASLYFADTSSSADSAFYEIHNHYTQPALYVHRRALEAEEAAQNGAQ